MRSFIEESSTKFVSSATKGSDSSLRTHIIRQHFVKFACGVAGCSSTFSYKADYKIHLKRAAKINELTHLNIWVLGIFCFLDLWATKWTENLNKSREQIKNVWLWRDEKFQSSVEKVPKLLFNRLFGFDRQNSKEN